MMLPYLINEVKEDESSKVALLIPIQYFSFIISFQWDCLPMRYFTKYHFLGYKFNCCTVKPTLTNDDHLDQQ